MKSFTFPFRFFTDIQRAIRVPFSPENAERQYRHPTFALHQHHYMGKVEIGGEVFPLRPGDITLSPSGVVSRYELENAGHHWCIHFLVGLEESSPAEKFEIPLRIPAASGTSWIGAEMQAIHDLHHLESAPPFQQSPHDGTLERILQRRAATTRLESLLLSIGLHSMRMRRSGRRAAPKSDAALTAAREQLERDFARPLNIAEIVKASGLSPHYFAARFQKRFGVTASEYLLDCRLDMARHLLLDTTLAIKEIAFECGIPDPQYFNKQFRRKVGISPSAYRANGHYPPPPPETEPSPKVAALIKLLDDENL